MEAKNRAWLKTGKVASRVGAGGGGIRADFIGGKLS
jgi:hypothetical protein